MSSCRESLIALSGMRSSTTSTSSGSSSLACGMPYPHLIFPKSTRQLPWKLQPNSSYRGRDIGFTNPWTFIDSTPWAWRWPWARQQPAQRRRVDVCFAARTGVIATDSLPSPHADVGHRREGLQHPVCRAFSSGGGIRGPDRRNGRRRGAGGCALRPSTEHWTLTRSLAATRRPGREPGAVRGVFPKAKLRWRRRSETNKKPLR